MVGKILTALVAVLHFYFLILEMFLWTRPVGLRVFRNSLQKAQDSAVLAANQGLYNGFLAAGLVWSLFEADPILATKLKIYFLSCVLVAGLYGAYSVHRRVLYVQAMPALLALLFVWLW